MFLLAKQYTPLKYSCGMKPFSSFRRASIGFCNKNKEKYYINK